jgi:nitrate reductase gamma subunit
MVTLTGLQIFLLLSVVIFIVVVSIRTLKILQAPTHLRWEIMPIPHDKKRFGYGGSHYEELNYWEKPGEKSHLTELRAMAEEILFIKSLFERNRQLWWFSYPFHLGLYMLIGFVVLLLMGVGIEVGGGKVAPGIGVCTTVINSGTVLLGIAGMILGSIGAIGLLIKRIFRMELRTYSTPVDYVNLILWLAVLTTGLASVWMGDSSFSGLRQFVGGYLTLTPVGAANPAMQAHLIVTGIMFIYWPFTHMVHFVAKYFAYHVIRWADDPMTAGSALQRAMNKQLGYRNTWSAPHIANGTWVDAATKHEGKDNG